MRTRPSPRAVRLFIATLVASVLFVLGSPAYYSRFGFRSAPARDLRYGGEPLDSAFQVLELVPGALAGSRGWVRYHPAFAGF